MTLIHDYWRKKKKKTAGDSQRRNQKYKIANMGVQRNRKFKTPAYAVFKLRFTAAYIVDHIIHRCFPDRFR